MVLEIFLHFTEFHSRSLKSSELQDIGPVLRGQVQSTLMPTQPANDCSQTSPSIIQSRFHRLSLKLERYEYSLCSGFHVHTVLGSLTEISSVIWLWQDVQFWSLLKKSASILPGADSDKYHWYKKPLKSEVSEWTLWSISCLRLFHSQVMFSVQPYVTSLD